MRELDALVTEYQHEKHRPRESEALATLRKVASLVKPIMRQRGWRVGTLCEFYPKQRNLLGLNINRGEKICLRLRYPSDERQFLPLNEVVDTMLHELCHNVHGPHNQEFHALWNQLRDEHMELTLKGYSGEGFLSDGKRLGGRRVPMHEARRIARVAAEKRQTLTAGSGQKLGGAPVRRGQNIRQIIADAAQRRITVTNGCASGTSEGDKLAEEASRNGFKTKAEEDDANERAIMEAYIDLIQQEEKEQYGSSYIPPSAENPAGPRSSLSPPPVPKNTNPKLPPPAPAPFPAGNPIQLSGDGDASPESWTCLVCTLINPESFLCCDACTSERPQSRLSKATGKPTGKPLSQTSRASTTGSNKNPRTSAVNALHELEQQAPKKPLGWICHSCGTFMETEWWTCAGCGTMKLTS
ncbi:hypothetical protein AJ80_09780 [Polytolypa hystricis UAMH7299]|uniref:WLM domain-containing protein n=1 Tax=Polytolypa hystricis (strain UAMH7299) TaxID=1447883 RepID=A0A2B7WJU2_POLH7|nr:hypothetical protein AJ80_09780 [Polytolypa hystricis UAMH7299]